MVVLLLPGFRLQLLQVVVELLEALAPRCTRVLRPSSDLVERRRAELTRPALGIPTAGDQPRALEHLQSTRDTSSVPVAFTPPSRAGYGNS